VPESTVDVDALYAALNAKRQATGLSWRSLAHELEIAPSTFTRMARGRRPDVDTFAGLLRWLDMPVEAFLQQSGAGTEAESEPIVKIGTYLRMDKNLSPKSVAALERLITVAYEALREDEPEQSDE
jgi:transcriptional regulator with XRE-family HTH domain